MPAFLRKADGKLSFSLRGPVCAGMRLRRSRIFVPPSSTLLQEPVSRSQRQFATLAATSWLVWKVATMKHVVALFLLVCLVLGATLIDVLAAIVGKRWEVVDAVDAWFRNSNCRLLR
jgi:hypothetical protein